MAVGQPRRATRPSRRRPHRGGPHRANLTWANLTRPNLTAARWHRKFPPIWPEGFDPPVNALAADEPADHEVESATAGPPKSAREFHLVRVESLDEEGLTGLIRGVEPLLAVVEELLASDRMPEETQAVVEHTTGGLRHETWENPGDPSPEVISSYTAKLFGLIAPYMSENVTDDPEEAPEVLEAAQQAVQHATGVGHPDAEIAGEAAADAGDDIVDLIAALEPPSNNPPSDGDGPPSDDHNSPGDEDPPSGDSEAAARRDVFAGLGWVPGPVALGLGPLLTLASPAWGAVVSAIGAVLTYLFPRTSDPAS